jgi:hypothetical protein
VSAPDARAPDARAADARAADARAADAVRSADAGGVRWVYVMGRGHSGSTVLDALLARAPGFVGTGELLSGLARFDDRCSCGATLGACPFWRGVRARFEARTGRPWADLVATSQAQGHVRRFPATLLARPDAPRVRRLRRLTHAVGAALAAEAGTAGVIDSSKEVTRALFLARFVPGVRFVHLVRHPHDVLASHRQRVRGGTGFRFLRRTYRREALEPAFLALAAANWLAGNALAEGVRRVAPPGRVLRVRFEDLCAAPRATLARLGAFLDADLRAVADAVEAGATLPLGHVASGNRMRLQGTFRFDPARRSARPLPAAYRRLANALTWPLMRAYGYHADGGVTGLG